MSTFGHSARSIALHDEFKGGVLSLLTSLLDSAFITRTQPSPCPSTLSLTNSGFSQAGGDSQRNEDTGCDRLHCLSKAHSVQGQRHAAVRYQHKPMGPRKVRNDFYPDRPHSCQHVFEGKLKWMRALGCARLVRIQANLKYFQ